MLTIVKRGDGSDSARSEGPYTGEMWRDLVQQDANGNSFGKVFFTPCARTYWHSHPGGQLLIVEHGEGLVGDENGTYKIGVGDYVWTPPNTRHWHGATSGRSMLHTAVTFGGATWEEEVPEEHYLEANSSAKS
ncbi:cupin domain-containing protein [Rhodococcus sp. NPDC056743]|uniref:cupin domain-containing protein n=1 Tax=Rhodococcus sp. NPDC056743 TaxID=3345934 RepID=UPI00366AD89F